MVPVASLRHAEYNPRFISEDDFNQIKTSITKFGFCQPLVVNDAHGREGIIIGGNQRFEVAKSLGHQTVPVYYKTIADLKEEKELNIRLNRNMGEFDFDILANEYDIEELLSYGFNEADLGAKIFVDEADQDATKTCEACGQTIRKKTRKRAASAGPAEF